MKGFFTGAFLLFWLLSARGQDHIYSQFYHIPNYLNPALNGQFEGDLRVSFIHRSQWANMPQPLKYYSFAVDYSVPQFGGGVGLLATRSNEGFGEIRTSLAGIYSYSVNWDNAVLSFGIQAGGIQLELDRSRLVFGDQLNENGIISGGGANIPEGSFNKKNFDAGAGINLVFFKAMIGGAIQHINKPNIDFTGVNAPLNRRFNAHASYRLSLDYYDDPNSAVLIPSVLYYSQGPLTSVSAGMQFKTKRINIGSWYRWNSGNQPDALILSFSFDVFSRSDSYDKVRVGISHDATASKLRYGETAGSNEAAITWEKIMPNRGSEFRSNYGKRCFDFY